MTKQPEALWIAAQLESWAMPGSFPSQAAAELRRLHEIKEELLAALRMSAAQRHALAVSMFNDPLLVQAEITERNARATIAKATGETE
jgi:hypothetical protein